MKDPFSYQWPFEAQAKLGLDIISTSTSNILLWIYFIVPFILIFPVYMVAVLVGFIFKNK